MRAGKLLAPMEFEWGFAIQSASAANTQHFLIVLILVIFALTVTEKWLYLCPLTYENQQHLKVESK